jgi:hypothetical protein
VTLYFLRSLNRVKVGIAGDFAHRLDVIRRGNFHPIEVLRAYNDYDNEYIKRLERDIHRELSTVCEHHEFFADGVEVQAVIDRLDRQFYPERFEEPHDPVPLTN